MMKTHFFFKYFFCLIVATASNGWAMAQTTNDSTEIAVPETADSIYDEYDDQYEEETYGNQKQNLPTETFDTLSGSSIETISNWRKMDSNYINDLKNNSSFSYVKNGIPKPKIEVPEQQKFNVGKVILYIAVALFIVILIWYLIENDLLLFRKKTVANAKGFNEETDEDLFSINFPQAIREAVQNGNYRLAIRLHYLQLLKTLSGKGIINYLPDKTNFEYLLQTKATPHYSDFFSVTRNYEYSWYGLFPIDEAQYKLIENSFANFNKKINQ